jgi:hypothetical protein
VVKLREILGASYINRNDLPAYGETYEAVLLIADRLAAAIEQRGRV